MDASVDAGKPDGGATDAGPADAGVDAGPTCGPEVCDGIDNDCNGSIDLLPDGGTIFGLCALQLGACQGAQIACTAGGFPPCTAAQYGVKYEAFESLCDGVDNDCSGVVDVSLWKPIAPPGPPTVAVSVPGAWYVAQSLEAQMFDETLEPLTNPFTVGRTGFTNGGAVWFGDYLHALFQATDAGQSHLRRLNLDGTFTGGADEVALPASRKPGGLSVSNDRSTLLIELDDVGSQRVFTLYSDGGTRADPMAIGGVNTPWRFASTAVGASSFVAAFSETTRLGIARVTADLGNEFQLDVPVPGDAADCAIAANTHALDAGSFVVACSDAGTLYGAEPPLFVFDPIWSADAGKVTSVVALPSYAKATLFWLYGSALWMGQLNGLPPVELARLSPAPAKIEVAESVRGGYLVQAIFDGGMGVRPYGAYVCPP